MLLPTALPVVSLKVNKARKKHKEIQNRKTKQKQKKKKKKMKTKLFPIITIAICLILTSCQTEIKQTLSKDTWNLRENASFEVEVAENVWWVPANALGKSRYTNSEIAYIARENAETRKEKISNLYEAIQLFQVSDFASDSYRDNLNVRKTDPKNGYDWEKHCPGYYAQSINRGNCSTNTNWLIYLLEDDYEEWGTFHYQAENGSGHVYNWFKVDGYYY